MKTAKTLFSSYRPEQLDDPWWDGKQPWWNCFYEYSGTRVRFIAGDVLAEVEHEGGGHAGLRFGIDIDLCQEDVPEFYLPDNPNAKYDIHCLDVIFWRWGFHLSIRGRVR